MGPGAERSARGGLMKAIETKYKGYRFRSRLEARWAVFFDALGLKWEYEPEGFELSNGERYLPDFRVQGSDCSVWVEVKPTTHRRFRAPLIYLAGKMDKCHKYSRGDDWRDALVTGGIEGGVHSNPKYAHRHFKNIRRHVCGDFVFRYCGPFRGPCMSAHGAEVHGTFEDDEYRDGVLNNALSGIDGADFVFAVVEDETAFGTFAEIGYARAKGKEVVGVFPVPEMSSDKYPNYDELWFVKELCSEVHEVLDPRVDFLKIATETLRRKGLAAEKEDKFAAHNAHVVVHGDPAEDKAGGGDLGHWFGDPITHDNLGNWHALWKRRFDVAAEKARSARFEHGEQG